MFADSRFDYLSNLRYYAAMVVTPLHFVSSLPARAVDSMVGTFRSRDELITENEQLQEQLLLQQYQLQKLEHLTAENARLNELLKASSIVDEVVVRVQLTGESPDPFAKRVVINKGSTEGVYIGQPVLDAFGLVGQVVEVEPLTSWVLLITDPQHSTPVQINRNGIRAIASGTRDGLHQLTLNNMPNTADIDVGDLLVTSGLGQRFPAGYKVGIVKSINHDPGKPFADVLVTPTAQFDRSRNLLLVFEDRTQKPPPAPFTGREVPAAPPLAAVAESSAEPRAETAAGTEAPSAPEAVQQQVVDPAVEADAETDLRRGQD